MTTQQTIQAARASLASITTSVNALINQLNLLEPGPSPSPQPSPSPSYSPRPSPSPSPSPNRS